MKASQKSTFKTIFLIQKGKCRADGKAPILARITVNKEMAHFSTKIYISPDRWLPEEYRTKGETKEEKQVNEILIDFYSTIKRKYNDMLFRGEVVTANKIKSSILCLDERSMTIVSLCDRFIADYEQLVLTQDYGKESFFRYKVCKSRLEEFMQTEYKCADMPIADINKRFLDKLYLWLRSEKGVNNNTAVKFLHRFSSIFKMARDNGWVQGDPFKLQHLHLDKVDRGYLTNEELRTMYTKVFETPRLEAVRDIFIFCCYTGLPYIDAKNLTYDHIKEWADGSLWISIHRTKTKVPVNVRLLEVPLMIMEKYKRQVKGNRVLPVPTNQKCNEYLKEIGEVCGLKKELTFHMARHTFATTITLENGVPIESVSKMLGHTNVRTTQIYARITDTKVSNDMSMLSAKIDGTLPHTTASPRKAKTAPKIREELKVFAEAAGIAL